MDLTCCVCLASPTESSWDRRNGLIFDICNECNFTICNNCAVKMDKLCPVCKKNKKLFISFDYGYSKTCLHQKDENGNNLNCRTHWANLDKEKASKSIKNSIKKLKETLSDIDPSKSIYDIKKENWYKTMTIKNEEGKDKFDLIGKKVSIHHLTIDPNTGKSFGTLSSLKAAETRRNKILPSGETMSHFSAQKSADTVASIIMSDGRTKKEHMTEHAMDTRVNTIPPNGLNLCQDSARKAYDTKIKNGTLPKYHGYSKMSEFIFKHFISESNSNIQRFSSKIYF